METVHFITWKSLDCLDSCIWIEIIWNHETPEESESCVCDTVRPVGWYCVTTGAGFGASGQFWNSSRQRGWGEDFQ